MLAYRPTATPSPHTDGGTHAYAYGNSHTDRAPAGDDVPTGWQKTDGKWYHYDADGVMQ